MLHSNVDSRSQRPRPILVVGLIRSGTKWLSNILCNHESIAGIQSERAGGILETNMFHRMQGKFDLRSSDDYIGFVELWRSTEFIRISGVDLDFCYALEPRPLSFVALFQSVMESYAASIGARYWLQKCGPERALDVIPQIGEPKIVTIRRDTIAVVRSMRHMTRNRDLEFSLLKSIPGVAREEKLLQKLESNYDVIPVKYEDLKRDPESIIRSVCGNLDLKYSETLLRVPFAPNTSFARNRPAPLHPVYVRCLRLAAAFSRCLPMPLLNSVLRIRPRKPPIRFVAGTFGDMKNRLADPRDYFS